MLALKLTPMYAGLAAGILLAVLTASALGGPPMSTATRPMVAPKTAPTPKAAPTSKAAASTTRTTGQPNQTCGSTSAPHTPGNAAAAPGSAFNPNGKAGMVYAGQQPQNSRNPTSVSQYDVACSH
jgi:hypothetical protein